MFNVMGTLTQNSEDPLNWTEHCLTRNLQVEVEVEVGVKKIDFNMIDLSEMQSNAASNK
jgi:hypothetical protein